MPTYTEADVDNELHKLLLRAVPPNAYGNKTLAHLAELIPVTRWSIQKWIINESIRPKWVKRLVEISKIGEPDGSPGRVSEDDFKRFVYNV